jgi:hypothetical protein
VLRAAFLVALVAGLGFAAHAGWRIAGQSGAGAEAQVEDWMSARHVVRVFGLSADTLAPLVGGEAGRPLPYGPLRDLAAEQGKTPGAMVAEVQALLDARADGP